MWACNAQAAPLLHLYVYLTANGKHERANVVETQSLMTVMKGTKVFRTGDKHVSQPLNDP